MQPKLLHVRSIILVSVAKVAVSSYQDSDQDIYQLSQLTVTIRIRSTQLTKLLLPLLGNQRVMKKSGRG